MQLLLRPRLGWLVAERGGFDESWSYVLPQDGVPDHFIGGLARRRVSTTRNPVFSSARNAAVLFQP